MAPINHRSYTYTHTHIYMCWEELKSGSSRIEVYNEWKGNWSTVVESGNSLIISLLYFSLRSFLHYWAQGFLVTGSSNHYSYNICTIEHVTFCHFEDCAFILIRARVERFLCERLIDTWLVCFFFFFYNLSRRKESEQRLHYVSVFFFYSVISLWLSFVMKRVQRTML